MNKLPTDLINHMHSFSNTQELTKSLLINKYQHFVVFDTLNTVDGAIVKIKDPMEYLKRLEFHKNSKNSEDYFF